MPAIEVEVPNELKVLLPEHHAATIVVGEKAYRMYPLAEGTCEHIAGELAELAVLLASAAAKNEEDSSFVVHAIQKIIESKKVPEILHKVLDLPLSTIQDNITIPQLKHVAGVLWAQNFDDANLPQVVVKNFEGLLGFMGMREQSDEMAYVVEGALAVMMSILETDAADDQKVREMQAVLSSQPDLVSYMQPSLRSITGAISTSKDDGTDSATSTDDDAAVASTTSASESASSD